MHPQSASLVLPRTPFAKTTANLGRTTMKSPLSLTLIVDRKAVGRAVRRGGTLRLR